jgi:hypothetical protein
MYVHRLVHLSMETYVSQEPGEEMIWKKKASEIVTLLFPIFRYEDRSTCSASCLAVIPYSDNQELRQNVATYLHFKGDYRGAEGRPVRCLEIRERAGSDTLTVTERLAGVYLAQGDYSKELDWFSRERLFILRRGIWPIARSSASYSTLSAEQIRKRVSPPIRC